MLAIPVTHSSGTGCTGYWEHSREQGHSDPTAQSRQSSRTDRPDLELMSQQTMADCDSAREQTSRGWRSFQGRESGWWMSFLWQSGRASLRRCPNPRVRLELKGLEEPGMKRAKGKGIQAMGTAYRAQPTKKGAAAEEPACPSAQASQALLPPVSPTCPQPNLASLTRIFALQTAPNELGPRDHWLVLGEQGSTGALGSVG